MADRWKAREERWADAAGRLPLGGLWVRALLAGVRHHAKDKAASIAYFGILSLFPLLLGLIALVSTVLKSERLRLNVLEWVNEFFPVGADWVTQNIESLIRLRGAAGIASILLLFWSASKMVGAISRGVNQALELKRPHAFILTRLRNSGLTLAITFLMVMSAAITPFADLLSKLDFQLVGPGASAIIDIIGGRLVGLLTTAAMMAATYMLVPYRRPAWPDLLHGLVPATLLIELGKMAFVYYVDNSAKFDLLYGSISSFIVLLLWLYFFGRVLLFGAAIIRVRQLDREAETGAGDSESELS